MTTTILNLGDSVNVDVASLHAAPKSNFVLVDTVINGDDREALYQKVTGDDEHPMSVRVGYYPKRTANGGHGQTNISIKISTSVEETDTNGDEVYVLPATITLASSMPGKSGVPDDTQFLELVGNLISWIAPVVSGAITSGALARLKFGVVNDLNGLTDSGSV